MEHIPVRWRHHNATPVANTIPSSRVSSSIASCSRRRKPARLPYRRSTGYPPPLLLNNPIRIEERIVQYLEGGAPGCFSTPMGPTSIREGGRPVTDEPILHQAGSMKIRALAVADFRIFEQRPDPGQIPEDIRQGLLFSREIYHQVRRFHHQRQERMSQLGSYP